MGEFLTQLWPLGATILVILGAAVLVALIVVLVRVAKTMKNVNVITQEAEEKVTPALKRVDPLIDRVELTVDTVNLELLRVDGILEDVESVTDVAGKTADTVSTITTGPSDAVASVVDRVRGALTSHHRNKQKEERFVYPIGSGSHETGGRHSATTTATKASAAASAETERSVEAGNPADAGAEGPTYEDLKEAAQSAADKIAASDGRSAQDKGTAGEAGSGGPAPGAEGGGA